ncbi:MAG: hypothetical protein ACTHLY_07535 [Pseudolabrys sp.]
MCSHHLTLVRILSPFKKGGLAAILFSALTLAPAFAQVPSAAQGRWSEDPAWCANTAQDGTDEMPITITKDGIETFASSCRVLSATRQGDIWRLKTTCRDEGQSEGEPRTPVTFEMRITGQRMALRDRVDERLLTKCLK